MKKDKEIILFAEGKGKANFTNVQQLDVKGMKFCSYDGMAVFEIEKDGKRKVIKMTGMYRQNHKFIAKAFDEIEEEGFTIKPYDIEKVIKREEQLSGLRNELYGGLIAIAAMTPGEYNEIVLEVERRQHKRTAKNPRSSSYRKQTSRNVKSTIKSRSLNNRNNFRGR